MDRTRPGEAAGTGAPFPIKAVETLLFATDRVAAGTFRCAPDHPLFADSGPCSTYCFVFPRTSVWIRHLASSPFVGCPALVALYNQGQEYSRRPLSPEGDRSDWFAVAPPMLEEALSALGAAAARGSRRLFTRPHVGCDSRLYLAQRQLQERLSRGLNSDSLGAEESITAMLESVIRRLRDRGVADEVVTPSQHDLANAAMGLLASRARERLELADLAAALGCSVFHLCRTFRRVTGTTMHQFRSQLRVLLALEPLAGSRPADLTSLALDLGYCSHSHFTATFRRAYGITPSEFAGSVTRSKLNVQRE